MSAAIEKDQVTAKQQANGVRLGELSEAMSAAASVGDFTLYKKLEGESDRLAFENRFLDAQLQEISRVQRVAEAQAQRDKFAEQRDAAPDVMTKQAEIVCQAIDALRTFRALDRQMTFFADEARAAVLNGLDPRRMGDMLSLWSGFTYELNAFREAFDRHERDLDGFSDIIVLRADKIARRLGMTLDDAAAEVQG
jgi:hypothetical protein